MFLALWYFFLALLQAGPNHGLSKGLRLYGDRFRLRDFDAACINTSAILSVISFIVLDKDEGVVAERSISRKFSLRLWISCILYCQ